MQEKTSRINAAMKAQTYGVEIECNNITRQKAAAALAEFFGTGRTRFTGTYYNVYEAQDSKGRWWKCETDGSIAGGRDTQCEVVTPVLRYDDLELLQGAVRTLRKAGAKSSPSRGCGVHIHVGLRSDDGMNHTPATMRNLANLMASHEMQIVRACGIAPDRLGMWCKVVDRRFLEAVNAKKPETMEDLADVWYGILGSYDRTYHYNSSRYHMLNYHASFTKGTIEFRCFNFRDETPESKGGLHAGELKTWIQLVLCMSAMAKLQNRCSNTPQQTDNEKYAFRCWLLRLGMIGDEFKTAREILLKNLEGNSAWRMGA